jgi:hypothetical protein
MNVGSTYYSQYEAIIQTIMNLGYGGFTDDMESWVGTSFSAEAAFENALTTYLHTGSNFANGQPRLSMPTFTTYYWGEECLSSTPPSSSIDYALIQYYQIGQSSATMWWQWDFGTYSGYTFTVPCPIILLGSTESGLISGSYGTVASQIPWFDNMIQTYAHTNLCGFGMYHYEDLSSADWAAWTPWIESTLPSMGVPPA